MSDTKKNKPTKVYINSLKRDYRLYPRTQVDLLTVARFKEAIQAGANFPPIRACAKTGRIIDGFHRFTAYSELDYEYIEAIPEEVDDDADFFLRAVEANKAHGLGYLGTDREKIVKIARLFKLEYEKVAFAMAIPVQKLKDLMRATPSATGEAPVKIGTAHHKKSRAGQNRMDDPPRAAQPSRTSVPNGYLFFFNQVIHFLKSDGCDPSNQDILYKLRELEEALQKHLNPKGKQLTPLVLPPPVQAYLESWALRVDKPLINLVVERLIMDVEIDLDGQQCEGKLSAADAAIWEKQLAPFALLNRRKKAS